MRWELEEAAVGALAWALAPVALPLRAGRAVGRALAQVHLATVDGDVARWYVDDGQLSDEPLDGGLAPGELREARRRAVRLVEFFGGSDPHPTLDRPPTDAQRRYAAEAYPPSCFDGAER